MRIIDGRAHFRASLRDVVFHPGSPHRRNAERNGVKIPELTAVATAFPLQAYLNHSKWIVNCPDCNNAEFVHLDEPLFMCANCLNVKVGHKWRPVILPANRAQIERVMLARPMPMNRNWIPGETTAAIKRDNRLHGLSEEV